MEASLGSLTVPRASLKHSARVLASASNTDYVKLPFSNGSKCYLNCDHGLIVENIVEGSLGSYSGPGVSGWRTYCLWILTVAPSLDHTLINPPTVTFAIEDIDVNCERVSFMSTAC